VPTTNASAKFDGPIPPSPTIASATSFTLRDLYIRASISGNSLTTELESYLNVDETTISSLRKVNPQVHHFNDETDIHEKALAAILEVVTSNSKAAFEFNRIAEPPEGVREWWARLQNGSSKNVQSDAGNSAPGEPK
jgi:hypothetical protein